VHPVFFQWTLFGFQRMVAGYGTLLTLGVLCGVGTAVALARRRGLDPVNVLLVALVAVAAGLVGSYLLFVATMVPAAVRDPAVLLQGGLVFYGGPLAGIPAGWIASRRFRLSPFAVADLAAPALTLGHALGRMGCFLGGCCFGRPWDGPWAVTFTHFLAPAAHPPVPRHPVQLYEALVLLALSLATQLGWTRARRAGQIGLAYVAAYGCWRFAAELLRGDELRGYVLPGLVTTSQAIALVLVPASLFGLFWLGRRRGDRGRR
jgi:phosphatidylglycerol:prolipoprotein diacylglycerol transferase